MIHFVFYLFQLWIHISDSEIECWMWKMLNVEWHCHLLNHQMNLCEPMKCNLFHVNAIIFEPIIGMACWILRWNAFKMFNSQHIVNHIHQSHQFCARNPNAVKDKAKCFTKIMEMCNQILSHQWYIWISQETFFES